MKYVEAFDIAKIVRLNQRHVYRDGVERAAALAAAETKTIEEAANAIDAAFKQYRITAPRWDGSIA